MRILAIHNKYHDTAGEDMIFEVEEMVEDITGLLFSRGDEWDLVSKIVSLDLNSSLAVRPGNDARSTYMEKYIPEINYHML